MKRTLFYLLFCFRTLSEFIALSGYERAESTRQGKFFMTKKGLTDNIALDKVHGH